MGKVIPNKDYLLKIDVFDSESNFLCCEYVVGKMILGNWTIDAPSIFDYPTNYFEGSYKVLEWYDLDNIKNQSNDNKKSIQ